MEKPQILVLGSTGRTGNAMIAELEQRPGSLQVVYFLAQSRADRGMARTKNTILVTGIGRRRAEAYRDDDFAESVNCELFGIEICGLFGISVPLPIEPISRRILSELVEFLRYAPSF